MLKARQLGMSTLTSLLILDGCLFNRNWHAGIIDKTLKDAQEKLEKIRFAFDAMMSPPVNGADFIEDENDQNNINCFAKEIAGLAKGKITATEASFDHNSDVRIGTSLRGGTLQFLHVSEFGSVAANKPKTAREILSGGINTVGSKGVVVMESTHEGGKFGLNYQLTRHAMENAGKLRMTPLDFKFFFFPWHRQPEYRIEGDELTMSDQQRDYFARLEANGIVLDDDQKRWYLAQENTFGFLVRQEYPSTPEEAFEARIEGSIYGEAITRLRTMGRLKREFEADPNLPLYVSWDLGLGDYMSLWLIQPGADGIFYVLDCYTANNKELAHYMSIIRQWEARHGQVIARHLLPHDSAKRDYNLVSFDVHLARNGLSCMKVPRVPRIEEGIDATRRVLKTCVFHNRCSEPVVVDGEEYMSGLNALENYQWLPPGQNGALHRQPLHNACSHAADAFRTFAEACVHGFVSRDAQIVTRGSASFASKDIIIHDGFSNQPKRERKTAKGVPW